MTQLSRKFAAPKSKDKDQWRKIALLIERGFRFYSVYEQHGATKYKVAYPRTLAEAAEFVQRNSQETG